MGFGLFPVCVVLPHSSKPNSSSFGQCGAQLGWKLGLRPSAAERPTGSSISGAALLVIDAEAELDRLAGVAKLLHVRNFAPGHRALDDPRARHVADLQLASAGPSPSDFGWRG